MFFFIPFFMFSLRLIVFGLLSLRPLFLLLWLPNFLLLLLSLRPLLLRPLLPDFLLLLLSLRPSLLHPWLLNLLLMLLFWSLNLSLFFSLYFRPLLILMLPLLS
jgi:hypothetical protein